MSTLTKILVVVFVVLAIFSSVVFIAYANYTPNFREAYESQKTRANVAQMQTQAVLAKQQALQAAYEDLQKTTSSDAKAMQAALDGKQGQLDKALSDNAQLQATVESLKASQAQQAASLAELTKMNQEITQQLAQANKTIVGQNDQLRTLTQSITDRNLQVEQMTAQVRAYREQVDMLKSQLDDLQKSGGVVATKAGGSPGIAAAASKIDATVLAVRENLAKLNVGAADGVTEGTRFYVYRGDKLVGELDVAEVDANSSAGVMKDLQMTPQQGDKATTSLK